MCVLEIFFSRDQLQGFSQECLTCGENGKTFFHKPTLILPKPPHTHMRTLVSGFPGQGLCGEAPTPNINLRLKEGEGNPLFSVRGGLDTLPPRRSPPAQPTPSGATSSLGYRTPRAQPRAAPCPAALPSAPARRPPAFPPRRMRGHFPGGARGGWGGGAIATSVEGAREDGGRRREGRPGGPRSLPLAALRVGPGDPRPGRVR